MFTTLLFFYRQHVVVPMPQWVTYGVLLWFFITFCLTPIVAHIILCQNLDLGEMKKSYMKEYPDYCNQIPNYWNDTVIFLGWYGNAYLKAVLLYDLYFINASIVAILFFVHRLAAYLKTNTMSEYRRKFHRELIRSLLAQSMVHYNLMLLPSAIVVAGCFFRLHLPGFANICIILISLSDPCGLLTLLATHKDYRTAIISFSKKMWLRLNGQIFPTPLTASVISVNHSPNPSRRP